MTRIGMRTGAMSLALVLAGCGGGSPAPEGGETKAAPSQTASASRAAVPADELVMPPSWMPADWDRNVHGLGGKPMKADTEREFRQRMVAVTPFILWAVANDTLVTEAFEPIWVWYTAIRSCERGIQMSEDLAGEFGDRARGKAALTQARNELKAWAATQPRDMTLYFTAKLGQWNAADGSFQLQTPGVATTLKPQDLETRAPYYDGAVVELWRDGTRQAINHFQASLATPQCASTDGSKIYKFNRMSQWWVVFGDADEGVAGLVDYKSRELLPAITLTRDAAAALAQRNPERKVIVAVTFAPVGSSFFKNSDQSAIRAKFRQVTVTDALDGSVLASKNY